MRLVTIVVLALLVLPQAAAEADRLTGRVHTFRNSLNDDVPPDVPSVPPIPPVPEVPDVPTVPTLPPVPPIPEDPVPMPEVPPVEPGPLPEVPTPPQVPPVPGGAVCARLSDAVGLVPQQLLDPVPLADEIREPIAYLVPLCEQVLA